MGRFLKNYLLSKLCLEARFRMKKSCLVAQLQYATLFFLSYTKSCMQRRILKFFFGQSEVVLGSTTSTLIFFKKKTLTNTLNHDLCIFSHNVMYG